MQVGVTAVRDLKLKEALPLVSKLLSHPSSQVRVAVGQTISSFGVAARSYVPDLQRALAVETDYVAKRTLEGAIKSIGQAR